jgi:sugar phosphate isomerase/epimerase
MLKAFLSATGLPRLILGRLASLALGLTPAFCLAADLAPGKIGGSGSALLPKTSALRVADRAACSSLCLARQPADKAFRAIADMGFGWVDLSCLNWSPHVSVPALLADFDREAGRVESLLASNRLKVANLTFDAFSGRPYDSYEKQFQAVVKLAVRLKARLINLMAPSNKADRQEVAAELKRLQGMAAREGVILTVETHCDQITERPAEALWLCQQAPGLALTLDPSHCYAGPNQGANFDALFPLVQGTGFRAGGMSWAEIQMPWGQGPIDFAAVVRKLEAAGYRGFYVAEYIEGFNKVDPLVESRKFLQWLKGL